MKYNGKVLSTGGSVGSFLKRMERKSRMKKTWKRLVSLLLTAILLAAVLCLPTALAAEKAPNDYGIKEYVALGDSIAQGKNETTDGSGSYFGSFDVGYTSRVAYALGLLDNACRYQYTPQIPGVASATNSGRFYSVEQSRFHSWAAVAIRTGDLLYQLDESYPVTPSAYSERWLSTRISEMPKVRDKFLGDLKRADLISLNIGSNDVFVDPLMTTIWEMEKDYGIDDAKAVLMGLLGSLIGEGEKPALPEGVDETAFITDFLKRIVPRMLTGYGTFLKNYPIILQKLRALNPTAQIVVDGIHNPLHYLSLTDGKLPISIGELLDSLVLPMRTVIASLCAQYGCTYIDVVDIPLDGDNHPTIEGYQTMADRIVNRLRPVTSYKDVRLLTRENQKAALWGATTQVFPGVSDTKFLPGAFVTRAQVVAALNALTGGAEEMLGANDYRVLPRKQLIMLLHQFAKEHGDATAAASDALTWAAETGITKGISRLAMQSIVPSTRAQAVLFLYRFAQVWTPATQATEDVTATLTAAEAALN